MLSELWPVFTQFSTVNDKPTKKIHVVQGEIDKSSGNIQARLFMARGLVQDVEKLSKQDDIHDQVTRFTKVR